MIKLDKPESFYKTFERKGAGQETTHYCPGCGHGTIHKLVAEAVDDLGVQDHTGFSSRQHGFDSRWRCLKKGTRSGPSFVVARSGGLAN
jgi:hypothetical protein